MPSQRAAKALADQADGTDKALADMVAAELAALEDDLMTVDQAAEVMNLGRSSVTGAITRGELDSVRDYGPNRGRRGFRYLVSMAALIRWDERRG